MKKVCVGKSNVRDTRDITNIIKNYIKEDNDISKANRSYGYHGNNNSCCYHDEPFYIVDLDKVEDQFNRWVEYLPNIQPYFAVKSNPDNNIINLLAKLGCCFDCASKNELKNVLSIVHNPDKIIFANPCKVSSHLMYARDNNITMMTFDSMEELEKIYNIYPEAHILLRICVDDTNSMCKFNSKFGCPQNNILKIFEKVKKLHMNLVGFSFHVGSGCSDARSFYKAIEDCAVTYKASQEYGFNISIIDIGGGFPGVDKNIKFSDICDNINMAIADFFLYETSNNIIRFIAEPGRYFTEATHTLIINVIAKKKEDGVIKYYLSDGIYGSFNCINYDHQKPELIPLLSRYDDDPKYNSTFFGPTCDSLDCIYKDVPYYELNVGEWLYINDFGSYTISPSSSFNGFSVTNKKYIHTYATHTTNATLP
jgi:ornithine decarboxylase